MRCPTLAELPPPPAGRTGWPWTVESVTLPDRRPDGSAWPRISIVTPSYNQGDFLEETIRSVLLQGYPDLEYFVMDGGSTDASAEIIKRYEPWLAGWVSEKDRGQAHAINKGYEKVTGDIGAYINSDDVYGRNVFAHAAQTFLSETWDIFIGRQITAYRPAWFIFRRSWWLSLFDVLPGPFLAGVNYEISQESTFWRINRVQPEAFNESYHFCLDVEWFTRKSFGSTIALSSKRIGYFRDHPNSKTQTILPLSQKEAEDIWQRMNADYPSKAELVTLNARIAKNRRRILLDHLLKGHAVFSYRHPSRAGR